MMANEEEEDTDPEEHFFEFKIWGKSTTHDEAELRDLLYEFLKGKAEFRIA